MKAIYINGIRIDRVEEGSRVLAKSLLPAPAVVRRLNTTVPHVDGVLSTSLGRGMGIVQLKMMFTSTRDKSASENLVAWQILVTGAKKVKIQRDSNMPLLTNDVVDVAVSAPVWHSSSVIEAEATLTVQPYWVEQSQPIVTAVPLAGGLVVFSEFGKCSGKLVDAVVRFRGPFTRVVLSASNGTGLTVVGAFTQTDYVFVDLRNLRAWKSGRHDDWQASGSLVEWDYSAGGMLALEPEFEGGRCRYAVTVDCEGVGETSVLSVRSSKWYL